MKASRTCRQLPVAYVRGVTRHMRPLRCVHTLPNIAEHQTPLIFDNVVSSASRTLLTSPEMYDIGPFTYRRDEGYLSPQEVLIESILDALRSESTREVEWWGWSEWKSVEAHRDVDEEAAAARGELRFPTHSAVLYLDVEPGLCAPTCVWTKDFEADSSLLVVPAVSGRMLLFPGRLLHAVPRPTLAWLKAAGAAPTELAEPSQQVRRVLVLNLWQTHAPTDEDISCEDGGEEDIPVKGALHNEEEAVIIDEETLALLRCEPLERWQAVTGEHLGTNDIMGTTTTTAKTTTTTTPTSTPTTTLSTLAHGTDHPVVTTLWASPAAVASVLGSTHQAVWIKTQPSLSTDVTDTIGLVCALSRTIGVDATVGVPSRYGAREERSQGQL